MGIIEDSIASGILLIEAEAEIDRLKHQLKQVTRPEPSRLEIAAMLTEEQLKFLRQAALPLMQWLAENCHPHVTAIVVVPLAVTESRDRGRP